VLLKVADETGDGGSFVADVAGVDSDADAAEVGADIDGEVKVVAAILGRGRPSWFPRTLRNPHSMRGPEHRPFCNI
jgi:hypothetical protein